MLQYKRAFAQTLRVGSLLQFYARGLFRSPLLTKISWQSASRNKPKFLLWRFILSMHGMIDYPVRHFSGGEGAVSVTTPVKFALGLQACCIAA